MFDSSAPERAPSGGAQSRLRTYMAALLVLGGIVLLISMQKPEPGEERLAQAPPDPSGVSAPPRVDPARIPAADDLVAHSRWQREALDYLLPLSQEKLGIPPKETTIAALATRAFAEARGELVEMEGTIAALAAEEYEGGGLLWTVVLDDDDGSRAVVLKWALSSDPFQGRPEDALEFTTEYLEAGDRVRVRGLYVQRRTGTFGGLLVTDPVPVLLATPPTEAFRKVEARGTAIEDPGQAFWDEIRDRFLGGTKRLDEPALFQLVQWAREKGYPYFRDAIEKGELEARVWDQETFLRWSDEIESETVDAPRPFTEEARGKLFETRGLLAYYVQEGWGTVPRMGSAWGVDEYGVLGVFSDFYGNTIFKTISAFPLETYEGVAGELGEHIRVFGYFLKNHTYDTQKQREGGGRAEITMPVFVVVHAEPVQYEPSPYRQLIWIIAGVIVVLAILFYALLIRGERKEAKRMEAYRMKLKRRIREAEAKRASAADSGDGEKDEA